MLPAFRLLPVVAAVSAVAALALAGWLGLRPSSAGALGTLGVAPSSEQAARAGRLFAVDDEGRLVVDERTRLALAAQLALNPPDQVAALADAEARRLPPAAAADARDLVQRYCAYEEALAKRLPGPLSPQGADDHLAELSALSSLRIAYFGADLARRMFGAEEALSRRLLEQGSTRATPAPRASGGRSPPA